MYDQCQELLDRNAEASQESRRIHPDFCCNFLNRETDMAKPITVLTGMDYWLDNLMCNVPELAMCFHLDGIVQDYHIIKTEDIPRLNENCQFPPDEVLDVVRNILGFLKANCTHEGHTYWLFRQKGEDVVKLYDLTSLNAFEEDGQDNDNPFAKSVALLFYRVAHNMLNGGEELSSEDLAVAKLLLENCIKLSRHKDRDILLSAYYLLADLFLNKVPVQPTPTVCDKAELKDNCQLTGETTTESTVLTTEGTLKSVSVSLFREVGCRFPLDQDHPLPPLLVGSSLDRARLALEQISEALLAGDIFSFVAAVDTPLWKLQGICKLFSQAGSAYLLLAEVYLSQNSLGRALRYGKYSIFCSSASSKFLRRAEIAPFDESALSNAWQVCGDVHCLSTKLSELFSANLEDFQLENPEDSDLIHMAQCVLQCCGGMDETDITCLSLHTEIDTSLRQSIDCYKLASSFACTPSPQSLEERLGNVWNELGVFYLQVTINMDFNKDTKEVEKLWKSSYSCISDGLDVFKKTGNTVNQALLLANLGRLMLKCAHAYGMQCPQKGEEVCLQHERIWEYSQREKLYYSKSVDYYLDAKQVLRHRSVNPGVWTSMVVDLSRVCLTMGTIMMRHPPLSYLTQREISHEVSDVLNKALCIIEPELVSIGSSHQRYIELCKLAGDCHARLSELHHQNSLLSTLTSQRLKQLRTLTEKHYAKAYHVYKVEYHYCELLELIVDKSRHHEQHTQGKTRFKGLKLALSSLLQAVHPIQVISALPSPLPPATHSLNNSLLKQLINIVKQLLLTAKKSKNDALVPICKQMFGEVLQSSKQCELTAINLQYPMVMIELLTKLNELNIALQNS